MHNCVTSHLWLKSALHASSHPCMCTCVLRLGCFLFISPVFYFVPPFSFQPFLMFTSEFNERSRSNPLCDFRLGTVATSDHETPLTALRNDDIQDNDSKWDGILLSVTKIPPDDILEGLYKLRIRESETLKTVLELYNMEIHQKKAGPDYHRLKTMVKRSIEQAIRNKNFGIRIGNYEKKRRGQESGNKTACTKNSWRLLAMGNQRRVRERRQLQLPPRY